MKLRLSPAQIKTLEGEALAAFPEECCGLIVGITEADGFKAMRLTSSPNMVAGDRRRRFEVDPGLRIRLERELRGGPQAIIGHYHSHPNGEAAPSESDLAAAYEPNLIWLIIGVAKGRSPTIKAYRLAATGDRFDQVALS